MIPQMYLWISSNCKSLIGIKSGIRTITKLFNNKNPNTENNALEKKITSLKKKKIFFST